MNITENLKKAELLAPAGSFDAFRAALYGGADAVYMGGADFNARINAKNFTPYETEAAIYHAHENGVKIYITLNTLIKDTEMKKAAQFAFDLKNMGADALIVQDAGLAAYLHETIPDIQLHASTQMALHNANAAEFLKCHGFSRMVICREVSRHDLELLCRTSPVEIEMFVHGAICMGQSGQCLMSSFIGGRSGNRGECAQPCRMNYGGKSPLSMYDMCLAPHIPEILSMGVSSLKIEGRMKSPEYVYGVTSVYRRLIDENRAADEKELSFLRELFSRGGKFTDAYYTYEKERRFHRDLRCSGASRSDRDKALTEAAERKISEKLRSLPKLNISQTDNESAVFEPSRQPKTARGMKKIKKAEKLGIRIVFASGSAFSEKLLSQILSEDYGEKYLEGIYFPLSKAPEKHNVKYGISTPAAVRDTELCGFEKSLEAAREKGYEKCLVTNISHIASALKYGFELHGAPEMNVFNSESVKLWREEGFCSLTLSHECTLGAVRDTDKYKIPCGVTVYGRAPLMVLESCLVTSERKNRAECETCKAGCTARTSLTDSTRRTFPVICDGYGRNILYNTLPTCATDKISVLYDYGISFVTLYFTDEKPEDIIKIIKSAVKEKNIITDYTRGYLK